MFSLFSPLPYQNDPNFHTTAFLSGQSDMLRLSLCIRHPAPSHLPSVASGGDIFSGIFLFGMLFAPIWYDLCLSLKSV
jgi:hypothetical protein